MHVLDDVVGSFHSWFQLVIQLISHLRVTARFIDCKEKNHHRQMSRIIWCALLKSEPWWDDETYRDEEQHGNKQQQFSFHRKKIFMDLICCFMAPLKPVIEMRNLNSSFCFHLCFFFFFERPLAAACGIGSNHVRTSTGYTLNHKPCSIYMISAWHLSPPTSKLTGCTETNLLLFFQ